LALNPIPGDHGDRVLRDDLPDEVPVAMPVLPVDGGPFDDKPVGGRSLVRPVSPDDFLDDLLDVFPVDTISSSDDFPVEPLVDTIASEPPDVVDCPVDTI